MTRAADRVAKVEVCPIRDVGTGPFVITGLVPVIHDLLGWGDKDVEVNPAVTERERACSRNANARTQTL
jgi:hypothetical protein